MMNNKSIDLYYIFFSLKYLKYNDESDVFRIKFCTLKCRVNDHNLKDELT